MEDKEYLEKAKECQTMKTMAGRYRPRLINVSNSQGVIIEGISIENGPAWNFTCYIRTTSLRRIVRFIRYISTTATVLIPILQRIVSFLIAIFTTVMIRLQ